MRINVGGRGSGAHTMPIPGQEPRWEKPAYLQPGGAGQVRRTLAIRSRPGSLGMARVGRQSTEVGGHDFRQGIGDQRRSEGGRGDWICRCRHHASRPLWLFVGKSTIRYVPLPLLRRRPSCGGEYVRRA